MDQSITFDFDGTLCLADNSLPNERVCDEFRRLKDAGHTVGIVTARIQYESIIADEDSYNILSTFCNTNRLTPDFIIFTNNNRKWTFLLEVNSYIHYDDNLKELLIIKHELPNIKTIYIKPDYVDGII